MAKQLTTEKEIKKALKVKSFSELPLDKYDDLAQLLVNTKKDVAIGIINQLPEYMTYAKEMLSKLTEVCQGVLSEGKSAHNDPSPDPRSSVSGHGFPSGRRWPAGHQISRYTAESKRSSGKVPEKWPAEGDHTQPTGFSDQQTQNRTGWSE